MSKTVAFACGMARGRGAVGPRAAARPRAVGLPRRRARPGPGLDRDLRRGLAQAEHEVGADRVEVRRPARQVQDAQHARVRGVGEVEHVEGVDLLVGHHHREPVQPADRLDLLSGPSPSIAAIRVSAPQPVGAGPPTSRCRRTPPGRRRAARPAYSSIDQLLGDLAVDRAGTEVGAPRSRPGRRRRSGPAGAPGACRGPSGPCRGRDGTRRSSTYAGVGRGRDVEVAGGHIRDVGAVATAVASAVVGAARVEADDGQRAEPAERRRDRHGRAVGQARCGVPPPSVDGRQPVGDRSMRGPGPVGSERLASCGAPPG